jgi:probable HAF family extracellular repeat protein
MKRTVSLVSFAAVLFACLTPMPQLTAQALPQKNLQIHYRVIDLGTLGGTFGYAGGLNIWGSVVGGSTLAGDTAQHAYIWRNGQMTDLGTLGGLNSDAGFPPNDLNQVAGIAEISTPDPLGEDYCGFGTGLTCVPFLWQKGKMTTLPLLGGNNGITGEINIWGVIAGSSETTTQDPGCLPPQTFQSQPVYWSKGKVHQLPILSGDTVGIAQVINNPGQIAGRSGTCSRPGLHAVFWQDGRVMDMGNLGGTGGNNPFDINTWGQVVGFSFLAGDETAHAFLWDRHSGMKDLGTVPGDFLSFADGINDFGQVVGSSCDGDGNCRAFLWQKGIMTDLNTLIPPDSPLYLIDASGTINNVGQIAGLGVDLNSDEIHPFLLIPCVGACPSYGQNVGAASSENRRIVLSEKARQTLHRYAGRKQSPPGLRAAHPQ